MKQTIFIFLSLFLLTKTTLIHAQSNEVKFLIDTTISIMKNNSVNANTVNWDTLRHNALIQAKNIYNPFELGSTMRYLYKSINDFHGAFFWEDSTFQWHHYQPPISDSIMNEVKKGVKSITKVLDKNIGYLRIPSMPGGSKEDFDRKAQTLNDSLCVLLNRNIKGIILDARLDGGGAMFPMILGVKQLLSQGLLGSFRTKKKQDWFIKSNCFFIDTTLITEVKPKCDVDAQNIPIVILIGPGTGSSGEFFLMAFKGRKNIILLGSQTAGWVTINGGIPINDTAYMNLSVGYGADRNGKIYKEALKPDITVTSVDKFNDIANDEKVKAAIKCLNLHIQ
ncbi:MAG TPA: S41 family peptidase [Hanamia sp.]|nr:S41 family peptidase [Hanamia sp.]